MFNILIVDDDANNLYSISALFEQGDFHIEQASDGNEALKIIMEKPVDLVILDVQLPNYNGFQLAKMIKSRKSTQHIPIILASAVFKAQTFMEEGLEAGAVDYIIKPINGQILLSKVNHYRKYHETHLMFKSEIEFYKTVIGQICEEMTLLVQIYGEKLQYTSIPLESWSLGHVLSQEVIDEIVHETISSGINQLLELDYDHNEKTLVIRTASLTKEKKQMVLVIVGVQPNSL